MQRRYVTRSRQGYADTSQGGATNPLTKRLKGLLTKIDKQLEEYDSEIGGRLNMFETDQEGRIAVKDLKSALEVIRHRPSDEAISVLLEKLDVDHDSFVPLAEIIALSEGEGLGIVLGEEDEGADVVKEAESIIGAHTAAESAKDKADETEKEKKKEKKELKKEDIVEG